MSPENGGRFKQNDASLGCDNHAARGHGFRIAFDWKDVEGAAAYQIVFWHTGSAVPAVSNIVTASDYERVLCNAFVADANLDHWVWRVAAIDAAATPDTLWSEQREYGFQPCRIDDTIPCTAPPE